MIQNIMDRSFWHYFDNLIEILRALHESLTVFQFGDVYLRYVVKW